MKSDIRVPADRARREIESEGALLVCAYDEEKCQRFMFEGALTLKQLEERLPALPKSTDILLYCA